MSFRDSHLDRFLCRVHRRWVALCLLEQMGMGVAIGCGIMLPLMPFLIWYDQTTLPLAMLMLGAGALAGLIWGIMRRPTLMKTAMEADRQLDLNDLLGTAIAIRNQSADDIHPDWAETVLAMAEARCRGVSPSQILLRRLGMRAWSGIGLATALVLMAGMLSSNPQMSEAMAGEKLFLSQGELAREMARSRETERNPGGMESGRGIRRNNPSDPASSDETNIADQSQTTNQPGNRQGMPGMNAASPSAVGAGGGMARSATPQHETIPMHDAAAGNAQSQAQGVTGGGGKSSESIGSADGSGSSTMTGGSSPAHVAEEWNAKGNAGHGDEITPAEAAVPDGFRDLVREYFRVENQNNEIQKPNR